MICTHSPAEVGRKCSAKNVFLKLYKIHKKTTVSMFSGKICEMKSFTGSMEKRMGEIRLENISICDLPKQF